MEKLMDYFLSCKVEHHLIQDRESDKNTISVSATGFGYYAWAVAAEEGIIRREEAISWMNEAMDFVTKKRGWLYHFINPSGEPIMNKEVSTIDTTLYYLAARKAAQKLNALQDRVEEEINEIDVSWMLHDGLFCHGWSDGFLSHYWDDYNEGVLLYRLFNKSFYPRKIEYGLPLFVYYYPLCFYDEKEYRNHLDKAIDWQLNAYGFCGVTACDSPNGYSVNDVSIISPLSIWACSVFNEKAKLFLDKIPVAKTVPAYRCIDNWQAVDRVGIDHGSCLIILRERNVDIN